MSAALSVLSLVARFELGADRIQLAALLRGKQREDAKLRPQALLVTGELQLAELLGLCHHGGLVGSLGVEHGAKLLFQLVSLRPERRAFLARGLREGSDLACQRFVETESLGVLLEQLGEVRVPRPVVATTGAALVAFCACQRGGEGQTQRQARRQRPPKRRSAKNAPSGLGSVAHRGGSSVERIFDHQFLLEWLVWRLADWIDPSIDSDVSVDPRIQSLRFQET
jgi:hypothetical protein